MWFSPPLHTSAVLQPIFSGEIGEYVDYHIISRKLAPSPLKHIEYVVVDDTGKNAKTLLVEGLAANVDPLKNVRHFRAKIVETEDGKNVVTAILLDMDWCIKK